MSMRPAVASLGEIVDSSKQFARQLFTVGENRLELLILEVQEERTRLLHAILLALGVAASGLLALLALNVAIVVSLWHVAPVTALLISAGLYTAVGAGFYWRLNRLLRDWQMLSATLDQLQKDHACLKENLG